MRLIGGSWRCVLLLERACHHGQVLLTEALIDGLHPLVCQAGKGGDRSPQMTQAACSLDRPGSFWPPRAPTPAARRPV